MSHLTYAEAVVVGLVQGVTELFPISSLGHNVLIPALIGGSWAADLNVAAPKSPYLAFIVGMHVATALALMIYFWRDWIRIIAGFFSSIAQRQIRTVDQKLAWMIIVATVPVGLAGVVFDHEFRVLFGKPVRAAIFLAINGVILFAGEKLRTRRSLAADTGVAEERDSELALQAAGQAPRGPSAHASGPRAARQQEASQAVQADRRLTQLGFAEALIIGSAQILALLAGISRDGVAMVAGMFRGLSRGDAARFAFLLATPVILAAGLFKAHDLVTEGHGIYGQILVGSVLSGVGAYLSVRFLIRYFQTRTLTPFAVYCVLAGLGSVIYLSIK
jgi:undecaprenyl-diphosphatase